MKSQLLSSSFQFLIVLCLSHQPVLKAGPKAQGSVANLKFLFSIIKKA